MGYLIFILVSTALLGGFLALTGFEARRGVRLFASSREKLDQKTARAAFIMRHVDWNATIRDGVRILSARMIHDLAEFTLAAVRTVERLLTRAVRYLREHRHADVAPRQPRSLRTVTRALRRSLRRKPQQQTEE